MSRALAPVIQLNPHRFRLSSMICRASAAVGGGSRSGERGWLAISGIEVPSKKMLAHFELFFRCETCNIDSNMKRFAILLSLFLIAAVSSAQSTVDMRREAKEDLRRSEENLDKVYQQLLAKFDEKIADTDLRTKLKTELEQSEAAWLKYRPLEARLRNDVNTPEGTMSDLSYLTVLQEVTDERTNQLKKYLKDAMIFE